MTVGGILLAAIATIAAVLVVPEFRHFFHLDKPQTAQAETESTPTQAATPSSPPVQTEPSKPESSKPTSKPKNKKPAQKTTTHVIGDNNVAGNNVSGDKNVTGNSNQTAPTAIAPNGIAITGGTVTNPTVNNFGPPPLQLTWSVSDTPSQASGLRFAKAVTVNSSAYYSPVYIAIFFDAEVDEVSPTGISMGVVIGYVNNDKKSWWLRLSSPPVTPDSPLTVMVKSSKPFNVLEVRKVETKQP